MAFILAGIIAVISIGFGILGFMGDAMSDAPGKTSGVAPFVIGGLIIAGLVAGSHWLHMSW